MTNEAIETTALPLTRDQGSPLPVFSGEMMTKALEAYRQLQRALDDGMPDQIMELEGKLFRKKGYWRAVRKAFSLTVDVVEERREIAGTFDDGRPNFGFVITCRASDPFGHSAVGDGACFAVEKARRFKCPHPERSGSARTLHFPHESCPDFDPSFQWRALPGQATEHNVRGHAHTRAFNRAVSNLVGFGEVSAEEVERDEHGASSAEAKSAPEVKSAPAARAADGSVLVMAGDEKTGTSEKGKAWTRYQVSFDDGTFGSTFDHALASEARKAKAEGRRVLPDLKQEGKFVNLCGWLARAAAEEQPSLPDTEPVGQPEKILTIRPGMTPSGGPYWQIQSNRRIYVTNLEAVFQAAERLRSEGRLALIEFEILRSERGAGYNKVTEIGEAPVAATA